MDLPFITTLTEDRAGAQPHPEDSVFSGSAAATQALDNLLSLIQNPSSVTIKFDGFPALIFGRVKGGQLAVMDKYMFDAKYFALSPEDWQKWDSKKASGKLRADLYPKLAAIWPGLAEAVGSSPGFFWGDLMWSQPLPVVGGKLVFKPNKVEYRIPANSQLGQQIKDSVGGIAVHQYFPSDSSPPQQWNGAGLNLYGTVAILTPTMGASFKLSDPASAIKAAKQALARGSEIDQFLAGLENPARTALLKYLNERARGNTTAPLADWLQGNISGKQYGILVGEEGQGYLNVNRQGLESLFNAWWALYNLKRTIATDLEQQVQGIEQYVNGKKQGEGFVFKTPQGLAKLVDKGGFNPGL